MLGALELICLHQLFLYLLDLQINLFKLSEVRGDLLKHRVVLYVFDKWDIVMDILEILVVSFFCQIWINLNCYLLSSNLTKIYLKWSCVKTLNRSKARIITCCSGLYSKGLELKFWARLFNCMLNIVSAFDLDTGAVVLRPYTFARVSSFNF